MIKRNKKGVKRTIRKKILSAVTVALMCLSFIFLAGSAGGYSEHQMQIEQFLVLFAVGLGFGIGFVISAGKVWDMEMEDYLNEGRY